MLLHVAPGYIGSNLVDLTFFVWWSFYDNILVDRWLIRSEVNEPWRMEEYCILILIIFDLFYMYAPGYIWSNLLELIFFVWRSSCDNIQVDRWTEEWQEWGQWTLEGWNSTTSSSSSSSQSLVCFTVMSVSGYNIINMMIEWWLEMKLKLGHFVQPNISTAYRQSDPNASIHSCVMADRGGVSWVG